MEPSHEAVWARVAAPREGATALGAVGRVMARLASRPAGSRASVPGNVTLSETLCLQQQALRQALPRTGERRGGLRPRARLLRRPAGGGDGATRRSFACGEPFVNDDLGRPVLAELAAHGTRLVALRSAGFNNVDLSAARDLGLTVMHVPDYSPYAVAEFTIALALALNRHLSRAYTHVREGNFSLQGLLGFDLHGKTAGVVGTGKIGGIVAETLLRASAAGCWPTTCSPTTGCGSSASSTWAWRVAPRIRPRHPALPADGRDAPPHRPDQYRRHEARRDAHQHQPRRAHRHRRGDRGTQVRAASVTSGWTSTRRRRGTSTRTTRAA